MDSTSSQPIPSEDEQINLRAYLSILLKRKWVVLSVFLAAVVAMGVYSLGQTRIYSAQTSIIIDMHTPQVLGEGVREVVEVGGGSYWYTKDFYETQYRVMKSRAVAQRVVDELGLHSDLSFLGLDKLPKDKQAEALKNVDAAAALQRRLFIEPVKDSRIVNLRVEDSDPDRAALLANALANAYQHSNLDRRTDSTQDAAQWLEDQLVDLKKNLSASELAMHEFKKDHDLIYTTFENKQTITGQKIVAIDETLTRIRTKKAELDARVKNISAARKSEDPSKLMELGVVSSNLFINSLKLEYAKIANEHADAKDRYGPDHPKMVALEERLKVARENLQNEVDTILGASLLEYRELEQTERNLEQMLSEVKKEAFENNRKEMDYKRLAREEENNQRLYDMVLKRMKELDLSALLKTNNIRILDEAKVSRVPIKPSVRKNVTLGAVLGLLAGIGLAFLLEYQDRSIKGHADIEALGLNFLGLVPSIPGGDASHPRDRDLYIHAHPKSNIAECCRTIRTNLMFLSPDKPMKTLVVTSAGAQEGKTTTLINLGMAFAQSGNRVLLIDTDMRKPRLHKSFGVSNELGLSTMIMGAGKLDDAIKSTEVPGLYILPSGPIPPNPAELLHTENFKQLAARLSEKFDKVIFDSPPIGAVTDPLLLANQMDGTLLVLKISKTSREMADHAVRSLKDANARILGAVLNDVDLAKQDHGYYVGYYYGYGNYYSEDKGRA